MLRRPGRATGDGVRRGAASWRGDCALVTPREEERNFAMPNHGAARQGLTSVLAAELRHLRDSAAWTRAPWTRRRDEYARLAFTELDIRRLDDRIDLLLETLAQLCDYSGQFDAAEDFRALSCEPAEPDRQLRLVQGQ